MCGIFIFVLGNFGGWATIRIEAFIGINTVSITSDNNVMFILTIPPFYLRNLPFFSNGRGTITLLQLDLCFGWWAIKRTAYSTKARCLFCPCSGVLVNQIRQSWIYKTSQFSVILPAAIV